MLLKQVYKCENCQKDNIDVLEIFPGNLCLECYEKKMNKIPLEKLEKSDFKKAINL